MNRFEQCGDEEDMQRDGRPCVVDMPARPEAASPVQMIAAAPIPPRSRPAYCDRVPGIANSECN